MVAGIYDHFTNFCNSIFDEEESLLKRICYRIFNVMISYGRKVRRMVCPSRTAFSSSSSSIFVMLAYSKGTDSVIFASVRIP